MGFFPAKVKTLAQLFLGDHFCFSCFSQPHLILHYNIVVFHLFCCGRLSGNYTNTFAKNIRILSAQRFL